MNWSHNLLWDKARLYAERAFSEQRTSSLFPLWAMVALEFLGRAALAKVHPSLLADQRDRNRNNLLYVFGYGDARSHPKSIAATTVFQICQVIIPDFTESESKFTKTLLGKRNEELHSGGFPYEDYPTSEWLAKYFKVCKLLLDFQGLSLNDFLGEEDGRVAQQMIEAAAEGKKAEVLKRIAAHKTIFESWGVDEQRERKEAGKLKMTPVGHRSKVVTCPSCESPCRITGEEIRTIRRLREEQELVWEIIVLPTHLKCSVCDLELSGHESLHIAQMGGQFSVEEPMDPADFYYDYYDEYEYAEHVPEPPWM